MASQPSPIISSSSPAPRKLGPPERKYKCQFCNRAFSRSEHRSRHERSHTKERPFKCSKCRSSFVRRDLLLRHDRTVHKDGVPLGAVGKRRGHKQTAAPSSSVAAPPTPTSVDTLGIDSAEDSAAEMHDVVAATMLANLQQNAHKRECDEAASSHRVSAEHSVFSPAPGSAAHLSPAGSAAFCAQMPPVAGSIPANQSLSHPGWDRPPFPSSPLVHSSTLAMSSAASSFTDPQLAGSQRSMATPVMSVTSSFASTVVLPHTESPMAWIHSPAPHSIGHLPRFDTQEQVDAAVEATRQIGNPNCEQYYQLPSPELLNRYLVAYFSQFHHHMPFLHPLSFRPETVSPPLLFAVLSIGALYAHNHEYASWFHLGAQELVRSFVDSKESFSSRQCPLWSLQATMLNMVYASWSGSPEGLEWACSIKGLLSNMVCGDIYRLKLRVEARNGTIPSRDEWLEDEACRRTYYAVYLLFGMLTVAYNHTPGIRFDDFVDLPLPSSELLWNSPPPSEAGWRQALAEADIVLFGEANDRLFQGVETAFSVFGTRVMVTALFLEVWSHKRRPEGLQDVATEYKLRRGLDAWELSLRLVERDSVDLMTGQHPLIINGRAMARAAKVRLSVDLKNVQEALRYHNDHEVAAAMAKARDLVVRSAPDMLAVVEECSDALEAILHPHGRMQAGWSVEHPLCSVELIVILTQWLSRLELDEQAPSIAEREVYGRLRGFFDEDSIQKHGGRLSWLVTSVWARVIDESVVWGICQSIGRAFQQYGAVLTSSSDPRGRSPCPGVSRNVAVLGIQAAY